MKRLTISTLLSGVLFLTSCNDFLNQEPLDQLSPNEYLTTESNIAAFATDQYQGQPSRGKVSAPMDMELLKLTITQIIWPVCNLT